MGWASIGIRSPLGLGVFRGQETNFKRGLLQILPLGYLLLSLGEFPLVALAAIGDIPLALGVLPPSIAPQDGVRQ